MASMTGSTNEFLRAVLSAQPYKPGHGAVARNATLAAFGVLILFGMYSWSTTQSEPVFKWGVPLVVGIVAGWVAFRAVHYPKFADFLISTQAEMNKVSWPSRSELRASTIVVLVNVFLLALFLFVADLFWRWVLSQLGILKIPNLLGGGANMFHLPSLPQISEMLAWLLL